MKRAQSLILAQNSEQLSSISAIGMCAHRSFVKMCKDGVCEADRRCLLTQNGAINIAPNIILHSTGFLSIASRSDVTQLHSAEPRWPMRPYTRRSLVASVGISGGSIK